MTPFHSLYWALLLTSRGTTGSIDALSRSIAGARVDLNPHQVDAALFALRSPLSRGVILADEVGLGKTIEAGLVIAQRWAERRRRILVITPAILRNQWRQELESKFLLPATVIDARTLDAQKAAHKPFAPGDRILIGSYQFASSRADDIRLVPWDLVVIDEAHRLRNVYKPGSRMARNITDATRHVRKLLLTATPLQNSLMELYGLVSVIDDQVFADEGVFRETFLRGPGEQRRFDQLRERLKPVCNRTLRKQVTEYVPFTRRIPITQDFFPSDIEHKLYTDVSEYLQREDLLALPKSQRALLTLVMRKLIASSTFAIGPTLRALADRLEHRATEDGLFDDLDLEGIDELLEELDEEDATVEPEKDIRVDADRVRAEIAELRAFADTAQGIDKNAKGESLGPALTRAFEKAASIGAPRKAVIFTESRRTQEYLHRHLSQNGFAGEVALLNGSNTDPESRAIHAEWASRASPDDRAMAKGVQVKTALVEHFRDTASILIATEAAAEGVNLQFCALVVNFDLPWNPQRIEQRIGRCHRYGQRHDVVVVNFLNRRNEADKRVFELLSEKFLLFEGIFGASDEILGSVQSGVDIERRIGEVYQTCRTTEEIKAAFDRIQAELEEQIRSRMQDTRTALLENFDAEVGERLRVSKDQTIASLGQRERWLLNLTRFELRGAVTFDEHKPRFTHPIDEASATYNFDWRDAERLGDAFYRQEHPLAAELIERALGRDVGTAHVVIGYTAQKSVITPVKELVGRAGWITVASLKIESFDTDEMVIVAGRVDDARGTASLDADLCARLLGVRARIEPLAGKPPSLRDELDAATASQVDAIDRRNATLFEEEVHKLDNWSADLKDGLERELKDLDRQIQDAKRLPPSPRLRLPGPSLSEKKRVEASDRPALEAEMAARAAHLAKFEQILNPSLAEKIEIQRRIRSLEAERSRKRRDLYTAQDAIDGQRGALIEKMEGQLKSRRTLTPRFTVRWSVV